MNGRQPDWKRYGPLAFFVAAFIILFGGTFRELFDYSQAPENRRQAAHIVLVPFVSAYLIVCARKSIAERVAYPGVIGLPVILAGFVLFLVGSRYMPGLPQADRLGVSTLGSLLTLAGGMVFFLGTEGFRAAAFPVLFLLFLVPLPTRLLDGVLTFLQVCSAELSYALFRLTGVSIAREGFVYFLPGATIEVARECSGARATISLFIVGVLAAHLFLRTGWRKVVLVLSTVPATILGNSVRIVGLTFLAIYVDMDFIRAESLPHLRGGWLFFLLDLLVMGVVLTLLRRSERGSARAPKEY